MADCDWDRANDHFEGIWMGLAKMLKYEHGTATYTRQLYAYLTTYMTMAFRLGEQQILFLSPRDMVELMHTNICHKSKAVKAELKSQLRWATLHEGCKTHAKGTILNVFKMKVNESSISTASNFPFYGEPFIVVFTLAPIEMMEDGECKIENDYKHGHRMQCSR
nr:hypothetical protein [Tanacetum cinerariifolium]